MKIVFIVWFKEMLDTLRDRRTLWAMVLGPVLIMPLFIILPQKLMTDQFNKQESAVITVAVSGGEHAPGLMAFLRSDPTIEVIESEALEPLLREEKALVGLRIPENFEADLTQEKQPGQIVILSDQSKMTAGVQTARVETLLMTYAQGIVAQRMAARGVDVTLLAPFETGHENLATPQQMGGMYLAMMLPMFIILWGLIGGMYTAIDVTAGEKERLTLEPLLMTPAGRVQVVSGKLLAVITTSLAALILAITSMLLAFMIAPPEMGATDGAVTYAVSLQTALLVLLAAVPIALMFGALEIAVCLFARSFKEAQNYIVPLQFVVLIPAMAVMLIPDFTPGLPVYAIPIFGSNLILRDLFLGTAGGLEFGVVLASSALYAAIGLVFAVWQFHREQVLFRT
ncbi:MAG: ABC transporter permease subunit [Anaerolineales bacterium]|nr:ABC transporter permease subunit [Anaerolineales bacterium]